MNLLTLLYIRLHAQQGCSIQAGGSLCLPPAAPGSIIFHHITTCTCMHASEVLYKVVNRAVIGQILKA